MELGIRRLLVTGGIPKSFVFISPPNRKVQHSQQVHACEKRKLETTVQPDAEVWKCSKINLKPPVGRVGLEELQHSTLIDMSLMITAR